MNRKSGRPQPKGIGVLHQVAPRLAKAWDEERAYQARLRDERGYCDTCGARCDQNGCTAHVCSIACARQGCRHFKAL